ncbi:serine/threonine protein kinase [Martiniozyma asiatica (nom. inval.)]|nr:serine/threonine protein kinase [Martiniozyma asiatica]
MSPQQAPMAPMPSLQMVEQEVTSGHSNETFTMKYQQRSMVGHGSFGYVYCIHILPEKKRAAIKTVLQDRRFKNRELEIMKLIKHKNVVDLLAYFYNSNEKDELYLYLILEYVPETLYTAIQHFFSKQRHMPMLAVKLYSYQLMRSLNYIHSLGICHRDIKPQNLLIDPVQGVLKLCDFGSAKILHPNEPNVSYICSRYYRAPELIFGARNYTTKIDVWSAGCVIAEMCLGQPLFPGQSGIDQLVEIIKLLGTPSKDQIRSMNPNYMEHKFPSIKPIALTRIFTHVDHDLIDLLNLIFDYSPIDRVTAIQSMAHECFDEFRTEEFQENVFPNYREFKIDQEYTVPKLLDFSKRELSTDPELWEKLLPDWLRSKDGINEFVPYTQQELLNPELND